MQRCTEKLLVVLSIHLRMLRTAVLKEYDHGRKAAARFALTEFLQCMSAALDYTKLDVIPIIKGADRVLRIGKNLRDELEKSRLP